MDNFIMFYAPFIALIAFIVAAFVVAPMDGWVIKQAKEEKKK
ncbi:cytochrome bd oxidase small subunit CydS [Sporosarcina sp. A2]